MRLNAIIFAIILLHCSVISIVNAADGQDLIDLIESKYPNTFRYFDTELQGLQSLKEFLKESKWSLNLPDSDPRMIELATRIDDVNVEIKALAELRDQARDDLIKLAHSKDPRFIRAYIDEYKSHPEKVSPAELARLQEELDSIGKNQRTLQNKLIANRDAIQKAKDAKDFVEHERLRNISHSLKGEIAKQKARAGVIKKNITGMEAVTQSMQAAKQKIFRIDSAQRQAMAEDVVRPAAHLDTSPAGSLRKANLFPPEDGSFPSDESIINRLRPSSGAPRVISSDVIMSSKPLPLPVNPESAKILGLMKTGGKVAGVVGAVTAAYDVAVVNNAEYAMTAYMDAMKQCRTLETQSFLTALWGRIKQAGVTIGVNTGVDDMAQFLLDGITKGNFNEDVKNNLKSGVDYIKNNCPSVFVALKADPKFIDGLGDIGVRTAVNPQVLELRQAPPNWWQKATTPKDDEWDPFKNMILQQ